MSLARHAGMYMEVPASLPYAAASKLLCLFAATSQTLLLAMPLSLGSPACGCLVSLTIHARRAPPSGDALLFPCVWLSLSYSRSHHHAGYRRGVVGPPAAGSLAMHARPLVGILTALSFLEGFDGEGLLGHAEHSGADDERDFHGIVVRLPVFSEYWLAVLV